MLDDDKVERRKHVQRCKNRANRTAVVQIDGESKPQPKTDRKNKALVQPEVADAEVADAKAESASTAGSSVETTVPASFLSLHV